MEGRQPEKENKLMINERLDSYYKEMALCWESIRINNKFIEKSFSDNILVEIKSLYSRDPDLGYIFGSKKFFDTLYDDRRFLEGRQPNAVLKAINSATFNMTVFIIRT